MSTSTHIYDNRSPLFKYTGAWDVGGTWNASSGQSGTLASTNNLSSSASFTFPSAASAFRYYGMKRSNGGLYSICFDCNLKNLNFSHANTPSLQTIDAFNQTDDGDSPPSLLYSLTFTPPSIHVVELFNEFDSRGNPKGSSQLTIDRFELDFPVAPHRNGSIVTTSTQILTQASKTSSVGIPSDICGSNNTTLAVIATDTTMSTTLYGSVDTTPVRSSTSSMARKICSKSAMDPSASVAHASAGSKTSRLRPIIGGTLGGLAAITVLLLVIFWLRSRKQKKRSLPTPMSQQLPISGLGQVEATTASPKPAPESRAIGDGHEGYEKEGRHQPYPPPLSGSSYSLASSSSVVEVSHTAPPSDVSTSASSRSHTLSYVTYHSPTSKTCPRQLEVCKDDEPTLSEEYVHQREDRALGSPDHPPRLIAQARLRLKRDPESQHLSIKVDRYSSAATTGPSTGPPCSLMC